MLVAVFIEIVNSHNIGVIDLGGEIGLTFESVDERLIFVVRRVKNLDCYKSSRFGIKRAIYRALRTGSDSFKDLISANCLSLVHTLIPTARCSDTSRIVLAAMSTHFVLAELLVDDRMASAT